MGAILIEFVKNPNLLGMDVSQYNPDKDSDGSGAKKLVDVLVEALTARLRAIAESETTVTGTDASSPAASSATATHDETSPVSQASDESGQENSSSEGPNSEEDPQAGCLRTRTDA
jgi:hypothetical protein